MAPAGPAIGWRHGYRVGRFRNDVVTGVGGKQVLIDDPIELFEYPRA
jgi:hypothetical protein